MSHPPAAQSAAPENLNQLDRQEPEPAAIASTRVTVEPGFEGTADRFSFEDYADRLMDDLFGDLEEALEQGRVVSTELPEELVMQQGRTARGTGTPTPVSVADVAIPPVLATRSQERIPESSWRKSSNEFDPSESGFVPELNPEPALIPQFEQELGEREPADDLVAAALQPQPPTTQRKSFDGLLALLVCGSLAAAVAIWYGMQGRWQSAAVPDAPDAAEVAAQPPSPENREFLDYIQRSLKVLESKAARSQAEATGPNAGGNLPSVAVAGNPTTPGSGAAGSDPVIVPVYRPPAGMVLPGRSGGFPNLPGFSLPGRSPAVSTVPLPQAPTAVPQTSSADPPTTAPNIAATATHTLVGILELSDPSRSAALFEINGTTQRVQVGEPIGSSGWTLVSVKGNEVMVRRNGDVRSVYTGQQF
ncbi:MAG: hypothetical protein Fur0046_04170 [Cyanobacteria bacterium J069]|nr:MAG: hypothetical protein D6742_16895 [Cyanobacteria bacterium J069]